MITSRGDVRYVVTEYGTAYMHGRTIRERALALIQIARPKFRPWLLAEAKGRNLVYPDQVELPVTTPVYPDHLECRIELKDKSRLFLRPLKLTDEPLLREMFYKLSPESVHHRFFYEWGYPVESELDSGVYTLRIPFAERKPGQPRERKPRNSEVTDSES